MKYSISQAARIVDVTRKTFYKHIEKRGISTELDDNNNTLVDASELMRVYGDQCNFDRADDTKKTVSSKQEETPVSKVNMGTDALILEEKLNAEKVRSELIQEQLEREKEINDELSRALRKAQDSNEMLLLEDKRKKDNGVGEWEKAFKSLEARLANREKDDKKRAEREQKIIEENKRLKTIAVRQKKALEDEKNKGFFQKLFG